MENPGGLDRQSSRHNRKWKGGINIMEMDCFDFRIIDMSDGNQIIDMGIKTPYEALEPIQMLEYSEMDAQLAIMERIARETRRQEEQQRKNSYSLLYKAASLFGLI